MLKAVRETEDALAKASLAKQRVSERAVAAAAAAKVEEFAQTQYEGGVADYFQAGEAHRYALMNKLALIKSRGDEFRAAVELVRAVGGSWTPNGPKSPALSKRRKGRSSADCSRSASALGFFALKIWAERGNHVPPFICQIFAA